ncbi:MAG: hypothetical protein GYB68_01195 [Chloroflexi bacterium]|nr:hypothetical protein [Chloroflexota bacterium]
MTDSIDEVDRLYGSKEWVETPIKEHRRATGLAYLVPLIAFPILVPIGILLWGGRESRFLRFHSVQALLIGVLNLFLSAPIAFLVAIPLAGLEDLTANPDRLTDLALPLSALACLGGYYLFYYGIRIYLGMRALGGTHTKLPLIGQGIENVLRNSERSQPGSV